jgi:hypothetical protein
MTTTQAFSLVEEGAQRPSRDLAWAGRRTGGTAALVGCANPSGTWLPTTLCH